jgi:hypothetical protein
MGPITIEPKRAWQLALGCWLPFVACAGVDGLVGVSVEPIMRDPGAHARLLVAIPLFIIGERVLRRFGSEVLMMLGREEVLADPRRLERLASGAERFLSARGVMVLLAVLSVVAGQYLYWSHDLGHGPAGLWYGWLAFPVFAFTGLRYCVRWILWAVTMLRLARLPLHTEPTHPDRAGGLAFVSRPMAGLVPLVLGLGAVSAATWAGKIATAHAKLPDLREPLVLGIAVLLVAAIVPYLPFAPVLLQTRHRGLRQYDRLAMLYSRLFHGRWVEHEPGPELLGTSDIQSLNDLAGAYSTVRRIRPLPFELRQLVALAVAVLVPFVVPVLMAVPLTTLLLGATRRLAGIGH